MSERAPAEVRRGAEATWKKSEEVGSLLGLRFVARLAQLAGRNAARFFLLLVTAYFYFTRQERVAACREFRLRAGAGTSPAAIFRHFLAFAHCALDRLYFLSGRHDLFRYFLVGHEHILNLVERKTGALLIGSHLGSFEALRGASRQYDLDLVVVADFENAKRMNAILSVFGDNSKTKFLDASRDRLTTIGHEAGGILGHGLGGC
jgi:predicted LPLAT superfamily acyltransferase